MTPALALPNVLSPRIADLPCAGWDFPIGPDPAAFCVGAPQPDMTPAPEAKPELSWLQRRIPKKVKATIRDYLASPPVPKNEVADAVAIGVLSTYSPIPFTTFVLAAGIAKFFNRNPYLAALASLYNNVLTAAPLMYAEYKVGSLLLPEASVFTSYLAGAALMAAVTPVVARQLTILLYDRLKEPSLNLMRYLAADGAPSAA